MPEKDQKGKRREYKIKINRGMEEIPFLGSRFKLVKIKGLYAVL